MRQNDRFPDSSCRRRARRLAWLLPALLAAPALALAADAGAGKALFGTHCAVCHQATGEGMKGVFPPLKGNAVVNADDATAHIHAVLFGVQGVKIDGVAYSAAMPPLGQTLKDDEVVAIINYERSAWGNHGKAITAKQVAAVRAKGK